MTHKNIFFIINENKLIYFIILKILLIYIIINNFITKNNNETALMINPLNLLNLQLMFNNSIDAYKTIALNKEQLLKILSINARKNISSVKSIFLSRNSIFENLVMTINNAIYYCEILHCKNIILDNKYYWFIKKKIKYKKNKIIIMNGNIHNFEGSNLIIDKTYNLLNLSSFFKIDIKINIIKKEILSNLPKVITNKNEIYII